MSEAASLIGSSSHQPSGCNAALILQDGTIFWGRGAGSPDQDFEQTAGEVCFNTSLTGYQEILTDPSYTGQIITFTCPHIGNVGTNEEDMEATIPNTKGCVLAANITEPANWRAANHLDSWLVSNGLSAVTGIDTRQVTRRIRSKGAINGVIAYSNRNSIDVSRAITVGKNLRSLEGLDLAKQVTCGQSYYWSKSTWTNKQGHINSKAENYLVVAMDFGAKQSILRCLKSAGCKVLVVPADTPAKEILGHHPDGIFLSNGPGDPEATGTYTVPTILKLIDSGIPIFGICLGHQMLALALGARTKKMHHGHRGANHPVKNLETGKVEITSQNHGFVVENKAIPTNIVITHISLFDGSIEGIKIKGKPIFSVQHHPEASPGPHDSHYLFDKFIDLMKSQC